MGRFTTAVSLTSGGELSPGAGLATGGGVLSGALLPPSQEITYDASWRGIARTAAPFVFPWRVDAPEKRLRERQVQARNLHPCSSVRGPARGRTRSPEVLANLFLCSLCGNIICYGFASFALCFILGFCLSRFNSTAVCVAGHVNWTRGRADRGDIDVLRLR